MLLKDFLKNKPTNTVVKKGDNLFRQDQLTEEDLNKEVKGFELIAMGGVVYIKE